jgi:hypothetical protein
VSSSTELLVLRLALIAIIFVFVALAALTMQRGLAGSPARPPRAARERIAPGARLVILSPAGTGLQPGDEFALAGEMTIGRDDDNGIVFGDASVSGRHALLVEQQAGWRLTDLGSTNGTLVNGRLLAGRPVRLRGGERIAFGSVVVQLRV